MVWSRSLARLSRPLVDRVGPRVVVILAQVVQAVEAFGYLTAGGGVMVVAAAMLLAAVAACSGLSLVGLRWLGTRLPGA